MDDKIRQARHERIKPYLPSLRKNEEPKITNKQTVLRLLQDLKDEGNALFREDAFEDSWQTYWHALIVARQLERTFYHIVDKHFMGVLFCNASLCSLKTGRNEEALKDADMALMCDSKNIKAVYRRALALTELNRNEEALEQALAGQREDPKNFQALIDELSSLLRTAKKEKTSVNAGKGDSSASSGTLSADSEWLAGTNAFVTAKRKETSHKKMPKKKRGNGSSAQTASAASASSRGQANAEQAKKRDPPEDSDQDSDPDSDGANDKEFAARMSHIQQNKRVTPPPTSKKEPAVRPFSPMNGNGKKEAKPMRKNAFGGSTSMGLDEFSLGTSRPKQSVSPGLKPSTNIVWPLSDKYDFCLACQTCFVKESEGKGGYRYREWLSHPCRHDVLLVRSKDNSNQNWLKVRPRIVHEGMPNVIKYKMCLQFQQNLPCRIGEANCTFAHNHVEVLLWGKDRNAEFSISGFLREAKKEGIFTSQILEQRGGSKGKTTGQTTYIPGLHVPESQKGSSKPPATSAVRSLKTTVPLPAATQHNPRTFHNSQFHMAHPPPQPARPQVPPAASPSASFSFAQSFQRSPLIDLSQPPPASTRQNNTHINIPNPLPGFQFKLCCQTCLHLMRGGEWKYEYSAVKHDCGQFWLAFHAPDQYNNNLWLRVRERLSHRNFQGNYILCHSAFHGDINLCTRKEGCSFAHNKLEQKIWKLEQQGKFDIGAFIMANRQAQPAAPGSSAMANHVEFLLDKFGGYFRFICRHCFFSPRPRINSKAAAGNFCTGSERHPWEQCKIIAHMLDMTCTPIDERKILHDTAFYLRCQNLHFCQRWVVNQCRFAHSEVERLVWMVERDTKISRDLLVKLSIEIFQRKHGMSKGSAADKQAGNAAGPTPTQSHSGAGSTSTSTPGYYAAAAPEPSPVPSVNLSQLCRTCWGTGQRCCEDADKDRCVKGHSNFKVNSVFVALPSGKEIRSLPSGRLNPNMKLVLCDFRANCKRPVCTHPHNQEESDVWTWMLKNNVRQLQEVCKRIKDHQKSKTRKITVGESVVSMGSGPKFPSSRPNEAKTLNQIVAPGDLFINEHYCHYCGTSFNSLRQWDDHCMTEKHINNVNSDKEHQWNYRQPPWGQGNSLALCAQHLYDKSCRYSYVPDMYNLCKYAHSQMELDEWRERHEWRQMKRTVAKERHMFSYTEALLEEYYKKDSSVSVISDYVRGVDVQCQEEQVLYKSEKNATFTWLFEVQVEDEKELERVALLYNKDRLHFVLKCPDGSHHQVAGGDLFLEVRGGAAVYKIEVHFTAGMFGSFSQWVVFDFGQRPVLVRKLAVEIGDQLQHEKVKELRENLSADRWTSQNREIVRAPKREEDKLTLELLLKYKEPAHSEAVVTLNSMTDLNQHNYIHKMHKLLELEEITRHGMIASYNLITNVVCTQTFDEPGIFLIAQNGDLFMKVKLSEYLTEDTLAGKLVLSSVSSVLFAPSNSHSQLVYEAVVMKDSDYNYDGRGKDYIYVVVSGAMAKQLGLSHSQQVEIELQFQMDRKFFCRMHYAIDCLTSTDVVFPDVMKFKPNTDQVTSMKVKSDVLNEDQMTAVRHIVLAPEGHNPPFIMYGPFGTGKTETLAQATMAVLKHKPDSHILICTQSNSAADLYITKHFATFFKKNGNLRMLRLMAEERRKETVPEVVIDFCCLSREGRFVIPARDLITQCQLVLVTVENSMQLTRLQLYDFFSHIFIDEAGQTLECETLMPLTLASTKTCVVMTGDHNQIGPIVYSQEARKQKFDVSILVRLYNYYEQITNCGISQVTERSKQSPLNILLSINYRTKPEILRFISSVFYGGPENLKAYGKIPSVVHITPLMFFAVQGREMQSETSTSYVNSAEAQEVVEQLQRLIDQWPEEWGRDSPEVAASQVAVIATYQDQVSYIRQSLRRVREKPYLKKVYVGSIHGIQGQEYRAIFLSTVRSTNLLQEDHLVRALETGEDIGDLGFLSNPKLINTALTRAQSFVAVVGDPVALCLIGECIQEWRTFIKHCSNMGSMRPQNVNYEFVRNQVIQIQISPAGKIIELIGKRSQENFKQIIRRKKRQVPAEQSENAVGETVSSGEKENMPSERAETNHKVAPPTAQPVSDPHLFSVKSSVLAKSRVVGVARQFSRDDLALSSSVASEDVILHLAKEAAKTDVGLRLESVHIELKDGFAVLQYDTSDQPKVPFRLTPESEDFMAFLIENKDQGMTQQFENYGPAALKEALCAENPQFLRCSLLFSNGGWYATVLPPLPDLSIPAGFSVGADIEIPGPLYCGHAFVGDIVLVALIGQSERGKPLGQVKGIFQRSLDPKGRLFVCTANAEDCRVLSPVNPDIPPIYCLTSAPRLKLVRRGNMSVYKFVSPGSVEFSHYEHVQEGEQTRQMFVVRYLTWEPTAKLPFGIVVGVLETDDTLDKGMQVLEAEYNVHRTLGPAVLEEADRLFPTDYSVPEHMFQGRVDLTSLFSFSVGAESSEEVEMAVSVTEVEDVYQIGLHVSDVVAFVDKGSLLDQQCAHRGATFLPLGKEPQHMFPPQVCTDICSLKPDFDRLAVSVTIQVDRDGNVLGMPDVFRSVINSKQHFSHTKVQEILLNPFEAETSYLNSCILVLYQLTYVWRSQRLGNGHFCHNLRAAEQLAQHSHLMMDEMKIKFNSIVADVLLSVFEDSTPLLVHSGPMSCKLDSWRIENAYHALSSVSMARAFREGEVCRCTKMCTCVFGYMRQNRLLNSLQKSTDSVAFLKDAWNFVSQAVSEDISDFELAQDLICSDNNKPTVAVAAQKLEAIQQPELFLSSHQVAPSDRKHYRLGVDAYTQFTCPLHRFISVVVQRMLVAYIEGSGTPYTSDEIESICWQATGVERQVAKFDREVYQLHLSSALEVHPIPVSCQVQSLDGCSAQLSFSGLDAVRDRHSDLQIRDLAPGKVTVAASEETTGLMWEKRVYSSVDLLNSRASSGTVELTTNRLMYNIPTLLWQKLLGATRERNEEAIATLVQEISNQIQVSEDVSSGSHMEVASGFSKDGQMRHYVPFTLTLHEGQPLTVQLSAEVREGLVRPSIQLLNITPSLDLCLEHQRDAVKCFVGTATQDAPQACASEDTLQVVFPLLRGLAEECAREAVASGERITVRSVQITWKAETSPHYGSSVVYGEFILSKEFCRVSSFQPDLGAKAASELLGNDNVFSDDLSYSLDFMCVRYADIEVPDEPVLEESVAAVVNTGHPITWVGHCRVLKVTKFANGFVVKVALVQSSMRMPAALLSDNGIAVPSTIEWIRKTGEHRLMDICVRSLHLASTFAKEVFTGKKPTNSIDPIPQDGSVLKSRLAEEQEEMISTAFQQPLTVVSGGPGTGKSLCAARLAYLLVQRNRTGDEVRQKRQNGGRTQLMICGASERSLDVITGLLKALNLLRISIVRVYSEEVEERDFPTSTTISPGEFSRSQSTCAVQKDVALHHLIRRPENPENQAILEQEMILSMSAGSPEPQFMKDFQACLDRAQLHELRKAQVILCTCATSARPILRQATCVKQIIMDDAGLIQESLAMVPLVSHPLVNQLLVLGDTQMPSLVSQFPGRHSGSRSLLARFADRAVKLTEQFRTVTGLCSFPSRQFYNGVLTTSSSILSPPPAPSIPWPGKVGFPSVFCHIEGAEEFTDSSSRDQDNVWNQKEADFVNGLVTALTRCHGVKDTSIQVLTMTRAQAEKVKQSVAPRIEVNTVLDAMGRESEYVILSCVRSLDSRKLHRPETRRWVKHHLGRVADPSVVNLALTRAKTALFIIGNRHLLGTSEMWSVLLNTYREKHSLEEEANAFLITMNNR
ncbi:helicase with zinc finger domain 2 isoform X2 [Aplysia californica]|uniref:Helicase with zinc finger domain 2 isoform X2 n=1 Tax=Aplysia californica TaxID=6500 RepID=A0ABM0ZUV8_APLCA|nr:helicase with zinc finger domain 2 isoform X2 [Aplysia californica]